MSAGYATGGCIIRGGHHARIMKTWDTKSIRKQFAFTARNAEIYTNELAGRIRQITKERSDYVKELHDEHLAKWYVYDFLSSSSCLESQERLLA